jgi:hypothetical protein
VRLSPELKRALKPAALQIERVLHALRYNRSALGLRLLERQQHGQIVRWERVGRPAPPPDTIKHAVIRAYAHRFGLGTLIETGTFVGDTPYALRDDFQRIVTIELDGRLAAAARRRFQHLAHITVIQGDSSIVLRDLASTIPDPVLFWLDGHWSGGVTALGNEISPILREAATILERNQERDVVLIDDARLFGTEGYPTVEHTQRFISSRRGTWQIYIEDDIIRAHAPRR